MFVFIATKTTADAVIPTTATSQAEFNRKVSNFSRGLVGGNITAGDLKFRPIEASIPNHLLCDGSLQDPLRFPNLFDAIGTTFGGDGVTTFALPDYTGALTITAPTVEQTVSDSGTVSTDDTTVAPAGTTGGTVGGNVPTGGRLRPTRNPEGEQP